MVIKTIDSIAKKSTVKNMTENTSKYHLAEDSTAKNMTENPTAENSTVKHHLPKTSTAKNMAEHYYFHSNKRSQAKNHAYVVTKATIKDNNVKICGYDEKGLLVGWGMNNRVIYSRVDNQCIAGWFKMMCENDNRVVGEILRSVEEYKLRHSKAKHSTANA